MVWLLELGPYAVALVCLAIAFLITVLVLGFLGWLINLLNKIPTVNIGTAWIHSVSAAVTSGLGKAFHELDGLVGKSFHLGANAFDWLWREFKGHALLIAQAATMLGLLMNVYSGLRSLVHHLAHVVDTGGSRADAELRRLARGIDRINSKIKSLDHRINDVVMPRVKEVEGEIAHVEDVVVPDIRTLVDGAIADVAALRKWIADNVPLIGTSVFAGAVAVALSAIGLGGLRCPSLLNSLKNRGCGLWKGLEDLLGLLIDAVALTHLCDLPKWIEELFSPLLGELTGLISSAANSLCAAANKDWSQLNVPNGPLPPPQTLYLPDNFG